jgi:sporulation protein YlmC with PRC-barrel domain
MTSGKYFNRGVKTIDKSDIGFVVKETPDKIIVFGGKNERYDIPIKEIQQVGANVLIGLKYDQVKKYSVSRDLPLPDGRTEPWETNERQVDLATYEGKYPSGLFNKGVRAKNEDHVGHVLKETRDTIVVFGESDIRYDIPKSEIYQVGMNVILKVDFSGLDKYKVNKDKSLPAN